MLVTLVVQEWQGNLNRSGLLHVQYIRGDMYVAGPHVAHVHVYSENKYVGLSKLSF